MDNIYRIEASNFVLEFIPVVFAEDLDMPVNTSLMIEVFSYEFSTTVGMDIGYHDLVSFVIRLKRLYETLTGSAVIAEPYGISFIEFTATIGGHITIKGRLNKKCLWVYARIIIRKRNRSNLLAWFCTKSV